MSTVEVAQASPSSNFSIGTGSPSIVGTPSNSSMCNSAASGVTTATSVSSASSNDLPASSYDGTHLHWRTFRRNVLAPHRICVIEGPPSYPLPESLLALIEASQHDVGKFEDQKKNFQEQVTQGRGFGPSPLFPPNLLPSIDCEPQLARCMVPSFDRRALPERVADHSGPFYELSKPRSGLACGFSHSALTDIEASKMPSHLIVNGTMVRFDTGYIAPGASLFCPFIVFERTYGQKEQRLQSANNQCAIAGAWCTRSLQMLYAKAWSPADRDRPDLPVSFSCTIDNEIAIINYHWIDGAHSYCMSPVIKFDLANTSHFHQFNIWIEAIGQWGLRTLLPNLKRALASIRQPTSPPATEETQFGRPDLKLNTVLKEDELVTALKSSFSQIPWRLEDDGFTPVSSSVASWGSPIIQDFYYNNTQYPVVPRMKPSSASSATVRNPLESKLSIATTVVAQPKAQQPQRRFKVSAPLTPTSLPTSSNDSGTGFITPPPSYLATDAELACQGRLTHAMEEIQNLQSQLQQLRQEMSALTTSYQTELFGLKNNLTTLLRKEVMGSASAGPSPRGRSTSSPTSLNLTMMTTSQTTKGVYTDLQQARQKSQASVITTPTDPKPKAYPWDKLRPQNRARSSLQHVMTINTSTEVVTTKPAEELSPSEQAETKSDNDHFSNNNKATLAEVPLPSAMASNPPTAKTARFQLTPGPMSAAFPSPAFSISARSDITNVLVVPPPPPKTADVLKWTAALLGAQTLGTFISSTAIRVVFLGCITDFALLAFASPHWPSTTRYFMELLRASQT